MQQKDAKKGTGPIRPRTSRLPVKRERQDVSNLVPANPVLTPLPQPFFGNVNDDIDATTFSANLSSFWREGPSQTLKLDEDSDFDSSPIARKTR